MDRGILYGGEKRVLVQDRAAGGSADKVFTVDPAEEGGVVLLQSSDGLFFQRDELIPVDFRLCRSLLELRVALRARSRNRGHQRHNREGKDETRLHATYTADRAWKAPPQHLRRRRCQPLH